MHFLFRPALYLAATNYALQLEQLSSLVEAIRGHQLSRLTGGQELDGEMIMAAAQPYMYSLRYHSSADYKVESIVNYSLGLTCCDLYRTAEDNVVYAGPTTLSEERQPKFDAARAKEFRHGKITNRELRFDPPELEPKYSEMILDNNLVVITNQI